MITKNEYDYKKSAAASRLTLPLGWDGRSRMITRMVVTDDDVDDDDDGGDDGKDLLSQELYVVAPDCLQGWTSLTGPT